MSWGGYIPGHLLQGMDPAKLEALLQDSPVPMVRVDNPPPLKVSSPETIPPRSNLIWAAVDLDGTLAEGVWTPDNPTAEIGPPREGVMKRVEELVYEGFKIVIHTSRPWTDYENIENWLKFWNIPFKLIVCGKLLAAVYIDDRAVSAFEDSWLPRKREE
jgi:hypothetical protein